ncbi:MAG: C2H2-type zinc finger protein [Candidatus Nanohaloarchaea archaeon]
MHPAIKILIGALMVVVGVFSTVTFLDELVMLIKAGIGPLLILVGAFIVWLESDEWKMRREQQQTLDVEDRFSAEEQETEEEDESYACPECGKEFDTERGMKIHQAQKHD